MEGQDIETMASMVCDDALICGTDPSEFWNKEQIIKEWENMLSMDPIKLDYVGDRILKINPDGKSAYSIDQFYFSLFTPNVAWRNVYNLIKVEGAWKINMWSSALVPENEDLATIAKAVAPVEE
jgi:ketosteroid isomerase-like protein